MIVVYIVAPIVGAFVVMALIGLALRRDHVAARQAELPKPPAEVYAAVCARMKEPQKVKMAIDLDRAPAGDTPGRVISRIADDDLPFGGRWIIDIAATDRGTRVTITEDGFIKNPLFRFLSRTVFSLTAGQEKWLRELGAVLGTPITPVPAEPART
jgi:hypothetical protein